MDGTSSMNVKLEEVITLVRLQLGKKDVLKTDRLIEDLGAESIDIANLISALETRFDVFIEEEQLVSVRTVLDLYELLG
jgi:acyl carrier protein